MDVRLGRPLGVISGRLQDVSLGRPRVGQIGSLGDVLGTSLENLVDQYLPAGLLLINLKSQRKKILRKIKTSKFSKQK